MIVGVLIFAPWLFLVAGIAFAAVAIPFAVFFAVWGGTIFLLAKAAPDSIGWGVALGFVLGIVAARSLVKRALGHDQ